MLNFFKKDRLKIKSIGCGFNFLTLCITTNDLKNLIPLKIDLLDNKIKKELNKSIPVKNYIKIFIDNNFDNSNPHFYHSAKENEKHCYSPFLEFEKSYILLDCTINKKIFSYIKKELNVGENSNVSLVNNCQAYNESDNYFVTFIQIGGKIFSVVRYNLSIKENYEKIELKKDFNAFIITEKNSRLFYIKELHCVLMFSLISENINRIDEYILKRNTMKEIEESLRG